MTELEPSFEPTAFDIICARGRTAYNHEGNRRFRKVLEKHLDKYKKATSKQQKSAIVVTILEDIQSKSRFVRCQADGKWFQVPPHVAKEKIGQGFRDLLHTRYRSATKSKVQLRRERRLRQSKVGADGKPSTEDLTTSSASSPKSHRPNNSCETLEPLPLDDDRAHPSESLNIYDCPFSFEVREESKANVGATEHSELLESKQEDEAQACDAKMEPTRDDLASLAESSGGNGSALVTPREYSDPASAETHQELARDQSFQSRPASTTSGLGSLSSFEQSPAASFHRRPYYHHHPPSSYYSPPSYYPPPRYPPPYSPQSDYHRSYYSPPDNPPSPYRPGWRSYDYYRYGRPPTPTSTRSYTPPHHPSSWWTQESGDHGHYTARDYYSSSQGWRDESDEYHR